MSSREVIMENINTDQKDTQSTENNNISDKEIACQFSFLYMGITFFLGVTVIILSIVSVAIATDYNHRHIITYSSECIGPGGGGAMFLPKINPHDSNNFVVSTDMGACYATRDRGKTWVRNRIVGHVRSITFDPVYPNIVYFAAQPCIYISEDYGFTSHLFFPKESDLISEYTFNEYQKRMILFNTTTTNYTWLSDGGSVEINPHDRNNILVLLANGELFETKDHGETFIKVHKFEYVNYQVEYEIYFFESDQSWVIYYKDLYKYKNGVMKNLYNKTEITAFSVTKDGYYLFISPNEHGNYTNSVYYTKDFVTINNFDAVLDQIPGKYETKWWSVSFGFQVKHAVGNNINDLYVGTDEAWGSATSNIIHITNKKDVSFAYSYPFLLPTKGVVEKGWHETSGWVGRNFGLTCKGKDVLFTTFATVYLYDGENCHNLAYDVMNDTAIVTADNKNTFITTTRGLDHVTTYYTRVDPFNKDHHIQCVTDFCTARTYDGGKTWFKYGDHNTCYDLHFDTKKEGVVYAIFSGRHDAPYTPKLNDDTAFDGAFGISYDGGRTFNYTYSSGLPKKIIPFKLEVVYHGNERHFYIASFNFGFWVSYDTGRTFKEMNQNIPKYDNRLIWAEDIEVKGGHIYGITACAREFNLDSYFMEYINNKWNMIKLPNNTYNLRDIVYSPKERTLYIACIPKQVWTDRPINIAGGVIAYKDNKFTTIFGEDQAIMGVNLNKHDDLYVTLNKGEVYMKKLYFDKFEFVIGKLFPMSRCISFLDENNFVVSTLGGGMQRVTKHDKYVRFW